GGGNAGLRPAAAGAGGRDGGSAGRQDPVADKGEDRQMQISRRGALALGAAAGLGLAAGSAQAQEVLKVGAYPANPPWQNITESGAFEGFEVDIANEIAKRMGTTAEIQGMDFRA